MSWLAGHGWPVTCGGSAEGFLPMVAPLLWQEASATICPLLVEVPENEVSSQGRGLRGLSTQRSAHDVVPYLSSSSLSSVS